MDLSLNVGKKSNNGNLALNVGKTFSRKFRSYKIKIDIYSNTKQNSVKKLKIF